MKVLRCRPRGWPLVYRNANRDRIEMDASVAEALLIHRALRRYADDYDSDAITGLHHDLERVFRQEDFAPKAKHD